MGTMRLLTSVLREADKGKGEERGLSAAVTRPARRRARTPTLRWKRV